MEFCFSAADIMLPETDLTKWAVIACDQFTSEPEYWENVKKTVGENPSSYNLILPEVYLKDNNSEDINKINRNMLKFEQDGLFKTYKDCLILVTRTLSDGSVRKGIVGKIDLTQYDYGEKSDAAIRATEKTVIERIPPRVEIRKNATLELPHIMLLIDDSEDLVFSKLSGENADLKPLYDFDLMLGAGHIKGELIGDKAKEDIITSLKSLSQKNDGFLFGVGDGNHSLASAKECYNLNKTPASRYALCEIVNIHDKSLNFEPIYRIVKNCNPKQIISDFVEFCGGEYFGADAQKFTCVYGETEEEISVKPLKELSVGTLQTFLDGHREKLNIDYIHGISSLKKLSKEENTLGFLFKGMEKGELFKSIAKDGSLPRKTFSMGHALDKRFYNEVRKIK